MLDSAVCSYQFFWGSTSIFDLHFILYSSVLKGPVYGPKTTGYGSHHHTLPIAGLKLNQIGQFCYEFARERDLHVTRLKICQFNSTLQHLGRVFVFASFCDHAVAGYVRCPLYKLAMQK